MLNDEVMRKEILSTKGAQYFKDGCSPSNPVQIIIPKKYDSRFYKTL